MPALRDQTPVINRDTLIRLRKARGWSQRELGRQAGVDQSTVSKVERGEMGNQCEGTCAKLAKALNVRPEELAGKPESPPPPRVRAPRRPPLAPAEPSPDTPLVQAILRAMGTLTPNFALADMQHAIAAAQATSAYLSPGCDLKGVAHALLQSARDYRLHNGKAEGASLAIVSKALYSSPVPARPHPFATDLPRSR